MLEELSTGRQACSADDCACSLPENPAIVFETQWGRRCAYECECGTVTITVSRSESTA